MSVYFILVKGTDAVKIGFSRNVEKRMREIQQYNHLDLEIIRIFDGTLGDEKTFHAQFSHLRIRGEWFVFHDDMMTALPVFPHHAKGVFGRGFVYGTSSGAVLSPETDKRLSANRIARIGEAA